ncbi:MAG: dipeptidase PepV [Erysipelothrix sp.]|nr:dipeptidase PepV [Erysipelothrix sp.]
MDYKLEANNRKQEIISDLRSLVNIKSIIDMENKTDKAPFGPNIRKALDRFLEMAKRDGFKAVDVDGYAGYIEYGEGEELVGVLGHLDVVPLGEGWTKDPLALEEVDGYLFGRGSSDDKGPTVAAYHALKILKDNNVKLNRRVRLIVGCDEETGFRGVEYYKKHCEIPNFGFTPDASFPVIYGEKGIIQLQLESSLKTMIVELNAGEVGNVVMGIAKAIISEKTKPQAFEQYLTDNNLTGSYTDNSYYIKGKFAHAMAPQEGVNAGVYLLGFLAINHDDDYAKKAYSLLNSYNGQGLNIDFTGEYMGKLTMNLGVFRVNQKNQTALIDIRYPDGYEDSDILSNIDKTVKDQGFNVNLLESKPKVFLDPKGEVIQILEAVYRKQTGDTTSPLITMGGGTYAKAFDNHVAYGMEFPLEQKPAMVGDVHQADEAISVDALINGTAIYAEAIVKLCNM